MKEIIISADGDSLVYLVPDEVANDLEKYCIGFCVEWMSTSPDAEKYRKNGCCHYNATDFIDYLNEYVFPKQKSVFVKNLGWTSLKKNLPAEYKKRPYFNF